MFACHSFMYAGKRYETPGSAAKDFIKTHGNVSGQSINMFLYHFPETQHPQGDRKNGRWLPHTVDCIRGRQLWI